MMRFTSRALIFAAVCAVASHASAAQGVLVVETTTIGGTPRTSQVQIEPNRIRTEMTGPDGTSQVLIFDGAKQVLYMVNPASKSYSMMTKAEVDAAGAQMGDMMAQMQAAMKDLPPAQRAQMEAMMKGRGMPGVAAAPRPEYRRGGTSKVSKWTCDVYESFQNNAKTGEVCTVSPTALGFSPTGFELTRQLADFMRGLSPQAADQIFQAGNATQQGFSGVPVRRVATVGGRETITELTTVSRQTFPDALFAVPEGFTQQASPLAGAGRGRGRGRQ